VRRRNHEELYEEHNDKRLMDQKVLADSRKKGNEHKAHVNIVEQEHMAHAKRVDKLCLNELSHIDRMYHKQMNNLIRQQVDITPPEFQRMKTQIERQKGEMENEVVEHGSLLQAKFFGQEHKHSNLFKNIEEQDDRARLAVNNLTANYNKAKKASYQEQFLFGINHEYPEVNMCLTGDCSSTHGDDYKFLNYPATRKSLFQNYRHTGM